jgi:hypothetical protein
MMKKIVLAAVAAVGLSLGAGAAFAAGPSTTNNGWYNNHAPAHGFGAFQGNDNGASAAGGGG